MSPAPIHRNTLFYGDNLDILRQHIPDECVDLVYLDPPFNSNRSYNVLFKDDSGKESDAQITAFGDSWRWGEHAEDAYRELLEGMSPAVSSLVSSLRQLLGDNHLMAYLVMMAARLVELRRVMKPTGSIYLHCDPTASHYLKIVMDSIFGVGCFRNEIVWRRTNAHNKVTKQYGPIHDIILFYTKSEDFVFHPGRRPYLREYVKSNFPYVDQRGNYQSNVLTGAGIRAGESGLPWHGYDPTPKGRHWAIPSKLLQNLDADFSSLSTQQTLDILDENGLILHPSSKGSLPRYKQYLDTSDGVIYQDIWAYQPGTSKLLVGSDDCIDQDVK